MPTSARVCERWDGDCTRSLLLPAYPRATARPPSSLVLTHAASTAERQLQIFNIELKQKVKSHTMHEDVVFWKWISPTTLGIVTNTAVYHWVAYAPTSAPSTPTADAPVKVFDRHASLAGNQIINYRVTPDDKWLVLIGISSNTTNPAGFKVKGAMQLYSRERGVSQPIEGHAASFAQLRLDGASADTKLFAFAVRTAQGAKVRRSQIGRASCRERVS